MIKEDVMRMFQKFHEKAKFEKILNATCIALVLKKVEAVMDREFRPINLVGRVYKLLAKVLTNRLKGLLGKFLYDSQNTLVQGRLWTLC